MFEAKVIKDSINVKGNRLTTLQISYPRFIHAEAKTHRIISNCGEEYIILTQDEGFMSDPMLSRNGSSSRAVPVNKFVKEVRENPAMPIHWGKNQPGMQAREENDSLVTVHDKVMTVQDSWKYAGSLMADVAEAMAAAGYHKQITNRLLEPFQWMRVIVTATEWDNFFQLRDHADAQPEMELLAKLMKQAIAESAPNALLPGEWHLPYVTKREYYGLKSCHMHILKQISTARCARVSYLTHDGNKPDEDKDIKLHDSLVNSTPIHASPTEHVAQATEDSDFHKNFRGFIQYRQEVEDRVWSGQVINKK